VELDDGHQVLTYLSGKTQQFLIHVMLDDCVALDKSASELLQSQLTFRITDNMLKQKKWIVAIIINILLKGFPYD
jgi:translation initiation factor IF-1